MSEKKNTPSYGVWLLGIAAICAMWAIVNLGESGTDEIVTWETDAALLAGSRDPDRPLTLVEFVLPGCPPCKAMASRVFSRPAVADAMRRFVPLRLDASKRDGERAARNFRISGTPAYVVLDPGGKALGMRSGFLPAAEFIKFLQEAESAYANARKSKEV